MVLRELGSAGEDMCLACYMCNTGMDRIPQGCNIAPGHGDLIYLQTKVESRYAYLLLFP